MTGRVLTLNAGSSSVKFAASVVPEAASVVATAPDAGIGVGAALRREWIGVAEGLGGEREATLEIRDSGGATLHRASLGPGATHKAALAVLLGWLRERATAIDAVGHRIVHGGTRFVTPQLIDDEAKAGIAALASLAPLHQPHNLAGVEAAQAAFPEVPHVACFDTAFHATQPEINRRFAIPSEWHQRGIRRYGFHGLSYESIVAQFPAIDPRLASGRVVVAHLGNGASLCAIEAGRSVATTMTFSPLDGLTMGTRCGAIDAAVVLHLMQVEGLGAEAVTGLLYRRSGLLGLSGISSDVRELEASSAPAAAEALDHFVEQVVQGIGRMAAALRGVDAIVFTGGIGENALRLRGRMVRACAWLGIVAADDEPTIGAGPTGRVGTLLTRADSRVAAYTVATDEEAVIAGHAVRLADLGAAA
jgi:acetate kinase